MKLRIFASICIMALFLCGCSSDVVWFEKKSTERLKAYSDNELDTDVYYVKQGTKFYPTLKLEAGTAKDKATAIKSNRIAPVVDDDLIPDHYIGELVAFTSTKAIISDVTLERFRDLGYSIGIFNAVIDENGMFYGSRQQNIVKDSSFYNEVKNEKSNDIRVVSINGRALEVSDIDYSSGTIKGLTKGETYHIGYYAGTYYKEADLVADTLILQSYEIFFYDQNAISYTTNGYMCFNTPEDLKSGYYYINGSGLFRYFDHAKGQSNEVDMNISYYDSEQARLEAYSRQYSINISTKVRDAAINVKYQNFNSTIDTDDIEGHIFSPDGTEYVMTHDSTERALSLHLTEAAIGEWKVNIIPKDLDITDVTFDSTKSDEDATLNEQTFTFEVDETNIVFAVDYKVSNDDPVFGYLVTEDGRTYDLADEYDKQAKTGRLYYELPYVPAGDYTVKIYYHPSTTELSEITANSNVSTETDIIYVGD